MNVRRRFLLLAVATYAVGAVVVIASPWHGHQPPRRMLADAVRVAQITDADQLKSPVMSKVSQPALPTLPVVTVRPDDGNASSRALRSHANTHAPLLNVARAASDSLLSNAAFRMPYYSFGRTMHREVRE